MNNDQSVAIQDALKMIMKDPAPKAKRNLVYDELRAQEKTIKAALKNGWSPTQLAMRLQKAGVAGSLERMRTEIQRIGGIEKHKRGRSTSKAQDIVKNPKYSIATGA